MEDKKIKSFKRIGWIIIQSLLMACAAYGISVIMVSNRRRHMIVIVITAILIFACDYVLLRLTALKEKKTKIISGIILGILNLCTIFIVAVYCFAPALLFYPNKDAAVYEEVKAYDNTEEVIIPTDQGQIKGWFLHNANEQAPLIIYFAGNGENASKRIKLIHDNKLDSLFEGYNFAVFSYPGYEDSTGIPSSESLKEMGLAVYDGIAARADVDSERIYLWGFSIGTGVANYVAANRNIQGLLLLAPYSNGYDLYNRFIPIFHGPLRWMVTYDMRADQFAKQILVKPTILASKSDEFVSYSSSAKLAKEYAKGSDLHTFVDLKHNDLWSNGEAEEVIRLYFREEMAR